MAIRSRSMLKVLYSTGAKPTGDTYSDWIDSYLHLTDATTQSVTSDVVFENIKVAGLITVSVAAGVSGGGGPAGFFKIVVNNSAFAVPFYEIA